MPGRVATIMISLAGCAKREIGLPARTIEVRRTSEQKGGA